VLVFLTASCELLSCKAGDGNQKCTTGRDRAWQQALQAPRTPLALGPPPGVAAEAPSSAPLVVDSIDSGWV
jgi:hypothetical protein